MEQREHIRIQVPLGVEVSHPAIGTVNTTARDISEGGVFISLVEPKIKASAKLKIKILNLIDTDTQHTPTVDMKVERVTDDGMGLSFSNKTAKHLWDSVKRLRDELQIGKDYFQVHQSIVLTSAAGALLVQQDGKWLLPGHYLTVGQVSEISLTKFVEKNLGIQVGSITLPVVADSAPDISILEAATFRIIYSAPAQETKLSIHEDSPIRDYRWVSKTRDLREITFASELQREAVEKVLESASD